MFSQNIKIQTGWSQLIERMKEVGQFWGLRGKVLKAKSHKFKSRENLDKGSGNITHEKKVESMTEHCRLDF